MSEQHEDRLAIARGIVVAVAMWLLLLAIAKAVL